MISPAGRAVFEDRGHRKQTGHGGEFFDFVRPQHKARPCPYCGSTIVDLADPDPVAIGVSLLGGAQRDRGPTGVFLLQGEGMDVADQIATEPARAAALRAAIATTSTSPDNQPDQDDELNQGRVAGVVSHLDVPEEPQDGDCLIWEPRIRTWLQAAGFRTRPAVVTGWVDPARTVLAFLHKVSLVSTERGQIIVDVTARQFDPRLPSRWVARPDDYCRQLAQATHCPRATIAAHDDVAAQVRHQSHQPGEHCTCRDRR